MDALDCYTRSQLQDYLLGQLPDEKIDLIARHLDHCETCEDTVVGLDLNEDTLVGMLLEKSEPHGYTIEDSAETPENASSNPHYLAAIERIQNLDFPSPRDTDPETPSRVIYRIGEYEIGKRLATGGMGSVYRARHRRLEKSVAVKLLPERKMQNADAIARFSREMKIIGQMDHPSMVQATDAGEIDGTHFLVMELVEGLDLSRIVRLCGRLNPADATEVIRCASIGLHDAHERGVIHRDVKPSNLMLNRDGATKILDLGLATLGGLHGHVDELTTVGQLMGTLDYMAPEQYGNDHSVDRRTDVYGLGATLYKLLTGTAPYSNPDANTPLKKMKAMATEHPTPILDRRPDLDSELASVVDKCLERDPADRFQTAYELSEALDCFATGHSLKTLLNSAEKRHADCDAPEPDQPLPVASQAGSAHNSPRNKSEPDAIPQPKLNGIGRFVTAAVAVLFAGLLTWGGIIIYLNTTAGQLVIESEIDNIKISVVQNEKPTREIEIEHGESVTRLRAGKYRIEIMGDTDELVIDQDVFELKRGGRVVVKITRKPTRLATTPANAKPLNSTTPDFTPPDDLPTYEGQNLAECVNQYITNASGGIANPLVATRSLIPQSSPEYIERLVSDVIRKYQNEIEEIRQINSVYVLSLLSTHDADSNSESLKKQVLEYWLHLVGRIKKPNDEKPGQPVPNSSPPRWGPPPRRINLPHSLVSALDLLSTNDFQLVQDFFVSHYPNASPTEKVMILRWLGVAQREHITSKQLAPMDASVFSEKWLPMVLKDSASDNVMLGSRAAYALVYWPQRNDISAQFEILLDSPSKSIRNLAVQALAKNHPDLPGLAQRAKQAVADGLSPVVYVDFIATGEGIRMIREFLAEPNQQERPGKQVQLIQTIGLRSNGDEFDDELKTQLALLMRMKIDRDDSKLSVLKQAWDAYSILTGEPKPKLHQGHELAYWQKRISDSKASSSMKMQCLSVIESLDPDGSLDSWKAIVKAVRNESANRQNYSSNETPTFVQLAVQYFVSNGPYRTRNHAINVGNFLRQFDQLDVGDLAFGLEILRSISFRTLNSFMGDPSIAQTVTHYLDQTLQSKNESIRRKAYQIICELYRVGNRSLGPDIIAWAMDTLSSLAESDNETMAMKLAVLQQLRDRSGEYGELLCNSIEIKSASPRILATILEIANQRNQTERQQLLGESLNVYDFALETIFEHGESQIDQIQLIPLDLWDGPIADDEESGAESVNLIELITEILDHDPRDHRLTSRRRQQTNAYWAKTNERYRKFMPKAIEVIESHLEKTTSKIERIQLLRVIQRLQETLKRLESLVELEEQIKN